MLRGRFIMINTYIKKNDLTYVESNKLIDTENKLVVARCKGWVQWVKVVKMDKLTVLK